MNFEEIEDLAVAKLAALANLNKFDSYETDIPVGTTRPNVNHAIQPYVLIDFSNPGQVEFGQQGITGTRDNLNYLSVVFEVVSNSPSVTRKITRIVNDEFLGWSPHPTWGQFVNRVAAPAFNRMAPEGGEFFPPRYYRTLAYVVDVNA